MQILTINNENFQKPSRNPSKRTKVKILKLKILYSSSKKFGSAYAQSPRKCSNIEILAKNEGKEVKFFSKIDEGHIRIWFRSKKIQNYLLLVYLWCLSSGVLSKRIEMTLVKSLYRIRFMYWRVFLNRGHDWNGVVSLYQAVLHSEVLTWNCSVIN
jgi:hypothetical protein